MAVARPARVPNRGEVVLDELGTLRPANLATVFAALAEMFEFS